MKNEKVSGKQLTLPYLNQSGFNHPILVTDKDGLSMTTPQVLSGVYIFHFAGQKYWFLVGWGKNMMIYKLKRRI